jgi:hypothetical protein
MRTLGSVLLALGLMLEVVVWAPRPVDAQGSSAPPTSTAPEADGSVLRDRAAAFWAARMAGDVEGQWQFLEPRGKGRLTAEEYAPPSTGGKYLGYQVEGVTINGYFATVKVRVLLLQNIPLSGAHRSIPPQVVIAEDPWIRIGGVWYRRIDEGKGAPTEAQGRQQ